MPIPNSCSDLINYHFDEEGIGILKMCDKKNNNALSLPMVQALTSLLSTIAEDSSLQVLIITGLPDIFCSGADKAILKSIAAGEISPLDITLSRYLINIPVPVIAAMSGAAVGGGFTLGLAADIVLISKQQRYGFTFMNMGFTPGMGTTALAEFFFFPSIAHELLYSGECKKGQEFIGKSGFNAILDTQDVMSKAKDIAQQIAHKPRLALLLLKQHLSEIKRQRLDTALEKEAKLHEITFQQEAISQWIEHDECK